ncbi:hypothetical protein B566_EDAN001009 [Ephemera danica]|nr:hypothetical protein B566_EDAN001009 [Ephemera danica]
MECNWPVSSDLSTVTCNFILNISGDFTVSTLIGVKEVTAALRTEQNVVCVFDSKIAGQCEDSRMTIIDLHHGVVLLTYTLSSTYKRNRILVACSHDLSECSKSALNEYQSSCNAEDTENSILARENGV